MPTQTRTSLAILNDAARGLAQQMVLWGQDVKHPAGNGLVRFGLGRRPSPGLTGTSCYSMPWENGMIELHGAVASWTAPPGETGCVYCRDRNRIELWAGGEAPVPGSHGGEAGTVQERWDAFQPLLRWLISYETWVFSALGEDWRRKGWRVVKRLPRGKSWLAPADALRWWRLAAEGNAPRAKALAG